MTLQTKDLLFFNKEGYPMNLNYDDNSGMWNGKIYFDKNSTDTFKTQGIYMFEKVEGSNHTFQSYLDKYQIFNTNGFKTFPKYNGIELIITNIETVNADPNYNTKWIYAVDIEKYFYQGMWIYFTNLNGYHLNDFDTINGNYQFRKILAVEKGRVLVWTETTNNIALAPFIATNAKIIPANVIEVQQDLVEPLWNETSLNTKLYNGKKISYIADSDNAGIYTIDNVCNSYLRNYNLLNPTAFVPVLGDKLRLDLELRTSNIPIANGYVSFASTGATFLTIDYIPSFLKVGDNIQAVAKINPLFLGNDATLTVISIDKTTNTIEVNLPLTAQYEDCYIYLATNVFRMEQDVVLDNNNLLSVPLTYWTMVNKYAEELADLPGGYRMEYIAATDELLLISDYTNNYAVLTFTVIDINGIPTSYPTTLGQYNVYLLNVIEDLIEEDYILPDSTIYYRDIVFTAIDTFGLNLRINGINYFVDFDTNINNTIADFISQHASTLAPLGITISQGTELTAGDKLSITSDFPNVPAFVELVLGDQTDYYVKYKDIEFNNIKTQLLITINEKNYIVPFSIDDTTTVTNWVNTYENILFTYGIVVSNTLNTIHFNLLDPEKTLEITYNIGYIPKSGDLSVYETELATNNNGSIITGNEIKCVTGLYDFLQYYSTGQKIAISGAAKTPQNKSYNIIGLNDDSISLSYQGAFWQEGLPVLDINIVSDYFIRFPKYGYTENNIIGNIKWSWKDTQVKDFFFYDFTGNQLKPHTANFPDYNGITPLCGPNGEIELKLIDKPNTDLNEISNPVKQQTVFDVIEYTLPFVDDNTSNGVEPEPLQVFIGYNADYEGWNRARIYLELIENIEYNLTTDTAFPTQDLWKFDGNTIELISPSTPTNFIQMGFTVGQVIEINSSDINIDGLQLAKLENTGKRYVIKEIYMQKIVVDEVVVSETSIKVVPKPTVPFYDPFGNALTVNRGLNVSIKVVPKVVAYFDIYGESEDEDERHKINLNNRNLNILKLQDFYIFKEVDINEEGIDWIFLNRKRKELIEIYPEIFNNLASYKSVIQAINFFGYNDLTFTEYFQNINPENKQFGQLMNMELLNIFDKSISGWQYSNLAYENLRNEGFRKTNLFSLNYKITDAQGNFINAYSLEEVKIKLLGLKKWLTENIIPIGTKIVDINGKYVMPSDFVLKHETYMTKNYRVEEYSYPIDFKVKGYLQPVSVGSTNYDINVEFFSQGPIEWYEYNIRTFYLTIWDPDATYLANTYVYYKGLVWLNTVNTIPGDEPGVTTNWHVSTLESVPYVQVLKDYKWTVDDTSFTINETIDPHFIVEVYWHSGYSTTHKQTKAYSVIPGFFDTI